VTPTGAGPDAGPANAPRMETALPAALERRTIENCPANRAIEALGDKWKLLIVIELGRGKPLRFGALQNALTGINQKVLTTALRGLERDGIVERVAYTELPPRVEYSLTERGRGALGVVQALQTWAEETGI
jgi:DNA-binding HxlR family transcriptional regulator